MFTACVSSALGASLCPSCPGAPVSYSPACTPHPVLPHLGLTGLMTVQQRISTSSQAILKTHTQHDVISAVGDTAAAGIQAGGGMPEWAGHLTRAGLVLGSSPDKPRG